MNKKIGFILSVLASILATYAYSYLSRFNIKIEVLLTIFISVFALVFATLKIICLIDIGIVNVLPTLQNSKYMPLKVMRSTKKELDFLGIYANKWLSDGAVRKKFMQFLSETKIKGGQVRFLLLDPNSETAETLYSGDKSIASSLDAIKKLVEEYPNVFIVRFYSDNPKFRIIIIDNKKIAVSGYTLDRDIYHKKKHGWTMPILEFKYDRNKSFSSAWRTFYEDLWNESRQI